MYKKEKWINGKLYYKFYPSGDWIEFTQRDYIQKIKEQEKILFNNNLIDFIEFKDDINYTPTYLFCLDDSNKDNNF